MLKIRLARVGKKRQPSYRIVVAEVESPRDGRYVEQIGFYNPMTHPATYKVQEGRALHWLSVGAQPTDAVRRLLVKQGTMDRLPRVHAGESVEALAAEFDGVPVEAAPAVEEVAEVAAEEAVEAAPEAVEEVAAEEAVAEEAVEEAAEPVAEVAEVAEEPAAEEAAPAEAVAADKLNKIEGIGPKVAELLTNNGIATFAQLSEASVESLTEILAGAGAPYASMVPDTWPQQAALAAAGSWDELTALQDSLDGGRPAA